MRKNRPILASLQKSLFCKYASFYVLHYWHGWLPVVFIVREFCQNEMLCCVHATQNKHALEKSSAPDTCLQAADFSAYFQQSGFAWRAKGRYGTRRLRRKGVFIWRKTGLLAALAGF